MAKALARNDLDPDAIGRLLAHLEGIDPRRLAEQVGEIPHQQLPPVGQRQLVTAAAGDVVEQRQASPARAAGFRLGQGAHVANGVAHEGHRIVDQVGQHDLALLTWRQGPAVVVSHFEDGGLDVDVIVPAPAALKGDVHALAAVEVVNRATEPAFHSLALVGEEHFAAGDDRVQRQASVSFFHLQRKTVACGRVGVDHPRLIALQLGDYLIHVFVVDIVRREADHARGYLFDLVHQSVAEGA